jgi:hypothetical protein
VKITGPFVFLSSELARRDYQSNLVACLDSNLITYRCSVAANRIREEPKRRRAEDEIRWDGEHRICIAGRITKTYALTAADGVYGHVRESLILDT